MSHSTSTSSSDERPALLGGEPACTDAWPVWPIYDHSEESALLDVLRSREWWFGQRVTTFEAAFANFQGAAHAVSCTNGTTAIEMALRALGVVAGDEVIVPPYTFIATASAVVTVGAIPVFADILPDTLCLDPDDVRRKMTPQTRAVIPVHVAGRVADMKRINQLAQQQSITVFEDAAHAWGSQYEGRGAGTLSRCGTFSFQVTKNITAGEGGILVTDDGELAELCRSFTHCGRVPNSAWYDHDQLGSNLRMTEFQAAMLCTQLARLDTQMLARHRSAELLDQIVNDIDGLRCLAPTPNMSRRSHHMYVFRVEESAGLTRDRWIEALCAEGVPVSSGWYRPLYRNGLFRNAHKGPKHGIRSPLAGMGIDYTATHCPVCEQVCKDAIWIPQHVLLSGEAQIQQIGEALRKIARCIGALGE